jgi:hypothetical protein
MKKASILSASIFAAILLLLTTASSGISASPSARGYHQMAYDSESGLVILYGGQTGNFFQDSDQLSHETWLYKPEANKWKQVLPEGTPDGSSGGDMTYNSRADRTILSVITDDWSILQTWAYDVKTNTWVQLQDGPYPMVGQRIVYDAESDRIIMFGGFELAKYKFVDETWAYDFNEDEWINMNPRIHPEPRNYHDMAYDSKADRVVLWGGDLNGSANKNAVWTYDYNTNTWEELNSKYANSPGLRDYMNLEYDEMADKFIMYGGYSYGNNETWSYDLNTNTWQLMQPVNNPGVISRYTMVYVKDTNETILFGGQDGATHYQYVGDTWSYKLKFDKWTSVSSGPD